VEIVAVLASIALICWVLVDSLETIVVPRRVVHKFRFARFYYRTAWRTWGALSQIFPAGKRREALLSWFGPLSLLGLFAAWMVGLVVGFALLNWGLKLPLHAPEPHATFFTYFYMSGVTFFTLGYGDVTPAAALGRFLAVVETGMGFGFLAGLISYLPVLYQAFSRRETTIALLDARAGSPPSAAQFLLRLIRSKHLDTVDPFLAEWERWSAELLESHLSFPLLSFYRSQHDNQSWLSALTTILDTCSLLIIGIKDSDAHQAQLTFAMARHAAVDLALVMNVAPLAPEVDRLPAEQLLYLRMQLRDAGFELRDGEASEARLKKLRGMYEPFVNALAERLLFNLPPIMPDVAAADNWQRSAGMPRTPGIGSLPSCAGDESHFG
jgi:hypothetical protein